MALCFRLMTARIWSKLKMFVIPDNKFYFYYYCSKSRGPQAPSPPTPRVHPCVEAYLSWFCSLTVQYHHQILTLRGDQSWQLTTNASVALT